MRWWFLPVLVACCGCSREPVAPAVPRARTEAPIAAERGSGVSSAAAARGPDAGALPAPSADAALSADGGADAAATPDDVAAAPFPEIGGDSERFPLHAIATNLETRIYPTPRAIGDRTGYLRTGARFRVALPIRGGGCVGAWHELPTGGFVCEHDGLEVSDSPIARPSAPPSPCMSCPLPYEYGFTRLAHTPMLSRLPDLAEAQLIDEMIVEREQAGRGPTRSPTTQPASDADAGGPIEGTSAPLPVPAPQPPEPEPEPDPGTVAEVSAGSEPSTAAEVRAAPSVLTWLERGFFVSINRLIGAKNRRLYFKTIYGRYVPENRVFRFSGFSPFKGVSIDESNPLPIYFAKATRAMLTPPQGSSGLERQRIDRLTRLLVTKTRGAHYVLATGQSIEKAQVARLELASPPADVSADERWIDVDLSEQTLVAYEGVCPILATMVSTGKEDFETPTGSFRIRSKHVATTMDGNTATDGPYSIEDVPWTMYFHRSYALHGAFWHRQYGIARSHGCVNLSPLDARFLFDWTLPRLPDGWHGVYATRDRPGTRVIVHE